MGYDGKKVVEFKLKKDQEEWAKQEREKFVGGREVGKFWQKNDMTLVVVGLAIFILAVLVLSIIFSPKASPPQEQPGQQQQKRALEPFVPPLLFGKPERPTERPVLPSWRQKRDAMIPIHSDHHGHRRHHGHHEYYGHSPHYSYPYSQSWGYYSSPYNPYGCYGCGLGYGSGGLTDPNFSTRYWLRQEEKRPYLDMKMLPNGQLERYRSGFE